MNNYIIILGGSIDQLCLFKNAKKLNLKTIVFDKNKNSPCFKFADLSFNIDFKNYIQVIRKIKIIKNKKKINISGIITMGCDVPFIVAKIAKEFNLTGNSLRSGKISENKFLMKKLFKKVKISTPKYALVKNRSEVIKFWNKYKCKYIILKPVDNSGSRGVKIVQFFDQIYAAIKIAKKHSISNKILVEEFIEGPQLSTESILVKKKIFTPGLSYRNYEDVRFFYPNILENGGTTPSKYFKFKHRVEKMKKKIATELDLDSGIIKGDFVINEKKQLKIIEFTTRLSGGDFSESLAPLSNGINYVKEAMKIACKKKINLDSLKPKFKKNVVNRYFFLPSGKLQKITGLYKLKKINEIKKIYFYYKENSNIPIIDSHGKRVGVFLIVCKNKKRVNEIVKYTYENVLFKVSNKWYTGQPKSMCGSNKLAKNLPFINMSR